MKKRNFSAEFKRESAQLVLDQNYTVAAAASAMDVGLSTMHQVLAGLNDTLEILEKHWGQYPPDSLRLLRKHCLSAVSLSPQAFFSELKNMLLRTGCVNR